MGEWGFGSGDSGQSLTPNPQSPLMLIQELPIGTDLDEPGEADSSRHWHAAPQAKFERLLRETQVPIGVLQPKIGLMGFAALNDKPVKFLIAVSLIFF